MDILNTDTDAVLGRDLEKKRKVDPEGFVCPNTPEIYKKPHFTHTAYNNEGMMYAGDQPDGVTSGYFQQTHDPQNYVTATGIESSTEFGSFMVMPDNEKGTQDYGYGNIRPDETDPGYIPGQTDSYTYTADTHLQTEDGSTSQGEHSTNLQNETLDTTNPILQYSKGEEAGQSSVYNHHQQQHQQQQQEEECLVQGRPCEEGDAATTRGNVQLEDALNRWKEDTSQLFDYWSNVFRHSQEFEEKTSEKLSQLLSKAKDLDQRILQQRETVMQRVQGIGKILELQN